MLLCLHRFTDLTPERLRTLGLSALLVDLDNTIVPPHAPLPTPEALAWVEQLRAAGVRIMVVSNNGQARVQTFCGGFEPALPGLWKAAKPFAHKLRAAMRTLGVTPEQTGFLGDQLFTDMLAAKLSGARAILVDAQVEEHDRFFRFKRACERIILPERRYLF